MKKIGVLFTTVIMVVLFALSANALDSTDRYDINALLNFGEFLTNATIQDDSHVHKYTKYVVAPSCTEKGYTVYICECGDGYVDNYVDMIDHKYESQIIKEATHYEEGEALFICVCGDRYTAVVDKLPHSYSTVVIPPTCLNPSFTTYTCDECGYSYISDYKEPKAHRYVVSEIVVAPTCVRTGYAVYACECEDSYMDVYAPSTGHDYDGDTCVNCGKSCHCNCHKSGFMGFIWKITLFFNKLFKTNSECDCGEMHY